MTERTPEPFDARDIKIGETRFHFHKMPPMEGWRVLNKVRHAMRTTSSNMPDAFPDREEATQLARGVGLKMMLSAITSVDPDDLDTICNDLFKHVRFFNRTHPDGSIVRGLEDAAFMDLEPAHVMEVAARAFWVNFQKSSLEILSWLPGETTEAATPRPST